jgi:hypothetical protein
MPRRKRIDQLHHAQRFYITDSELPWIRVTEHDINREFGTSLTCAAAPEVQRTTPEATPYYGLYIGRVQFVKPEMMVVPL